MNSGEKILLDFRVKNCIKTKSYQIIIKSDNKSLGLNRQFQTELIECKKDDEEIIFQKKLVLFYSFCQRQKLNVTFMVKYFIDNEQNFKIRNAIRETELASIITSPNSVYERNLIEKIKNKDIFCIKANKIKTGSNNEIKIYDFIKSGIKLNSFMAFDFSDGINKQPRKLSIENYSKIINNLNQKIFFYSESKSTYLYGFGGKMNKKEDLFNLNEIEDFPIALSKFNKVFDSKKNIIIPKKKVLISLLIRKITKIIYNLYEARHYNVLYIFEREIPDSGDKQELIDAFIEASYLPLTIIIIGEGKNDFNKLKELFSDKINEASSGMLKNRKNILFADFYNDYKENEEKLTHWCLEELSKQMIEFYELIKTTPEKILNDNMKEIEKSFMQYNLVSKCIYESNISNMKTSNNFRSNIFVSKNINNNYNKKDKKEKETPYKIQDINIKSKNEINNNNIINNKKYIFPQHSINVNYDLSNQYKEDEKEDKKIEKKGEEVKKKEESGLYYITAGESIFNYVPDNPFVEKDKKKYIIDTPGIPVLKLDPNNPYNESDKNKYKLGTPGKSIWKLDPNNPYNNIDEEENEDKEEVKAEKKENEIKEDEEENSKNKKYFLPQRSTCISIMENPFISEKDKKKIEQKKESKAEMYDTSTEESSKFSNNTNLKISNQIRFTFDYSVDN